MGAGVALAPSEVTPASGRSGAESQCLPVLADRPSVDLNFLVRKTVGEGRISVVMDRKSKVRFVRCYSRILTHAWSDDGFCALLEADPRRAIAQCGWMLPEGACVSVLRLMSQDPDIGSQRALWEAGEISGNYILVVPLLAMRELAETQLDGVVGGLQPGADRQERLFSKLIECSLSTGSIPRR
jgi:hypothetical protein